MGTVGARWWAHRRGAPADEGDARGTNRPTSRRLAAVVLAGALLAAACGDDDAGTPRAGPRLTGVHPTIALPTLGRPTDPGVLPGTREDVGPRQGSVLGVVGIAHGDALDVHAAPGEGEPVVARFAPLAAKVVAAGRTRSLPTARWYEVYLPDGSGWVRSTNVAYVATPRDVTAEAVAGLGAAAGGGTVAELGEAVARSRSAEEPSVRITVPVAAPPAASGAITVDVTGFADDVRWGERLVVTAAAGSAAGDAVITGVLAQALCRRGVTSDGRCV